MGSPLACDHVPDYRSGMGPTLADVGEDGLLERFAALLPAGGSLLVGPGDDCAVARVEGSDRDLLLKTDCVVEGVHYLPETPPEKVGRKALARALSDLAAMGGIPEHALVTLVLPSSTTAAWIDGFYDGLVELARVAGLRVAGGELARMPAGGAAVASVSLTGWVVKDKALLRSGGRPGHVVAVTGCLGGSFPSGHHLDFMPRLEQGQWLSQTGLVHAAMDLSDGLARDLPRLARRSGCGYALNQADLPCRPGFTPDQALSDGEDYELLLALPEPDWERLHGLWRDRFPDVGLTRIGSLTEARHGHEETTGGWDHFRSR